MKQANDTNYPGLIFRETFNSEQNTRKLGGTPTDVDYSNGVGSFNGSSSLIETANKFTSEGSIRIKFIAGETTTNVILLGSQTSPPNSRCYVSIEDDLFSGGIGGQNFNIIKGTTTIISGEEYEGVLTWDGSNVKLYLDGVEEYSNSQSGNAEISLDFFIGCNNFNGSDVNYIDSDLDFVEVYNRALTASEVANFYNGVENKEPNFTKQVVSRNLVKPLDFTNTSIWDNTGISETKNTFTTLSSGQGMRNLNLTRGKRYYIKLQGTTTTTDWQLRVTLNNSNIIYTTTDGIIDYEGSFVATERELIYLRHGSAGVSTINILELYEMDSKLLLDFDSTNGVLENRTEDDPIGSEKIDNSDDINFAIPGNVNWTGKDLDSFNITEGEMSFSASTSWKQAVLNAKYINNGNGFTVGKKYKITYVCTQSTGTCYISMDGLARYGNPISVGIHSVEKVAASNANLLFQFTEAIGGSVTIDNISVVEIQPELEATDVEIVRS